jgi:DNA polymerase III subunit epsilon
MGATREAGVQPALFERRDDDTPAAVETTANRFEGSVGLEPDEVERIIAILEMSGQYRILRRLRPRLPIGPPKDVRTRRGVFVDVETTGLDPIRDEIIELAMLKFDYSSDGEICATGESYEAFRDPGRPIPSAVTALTGITDAMVAGKFIDVDAISTFVDDVDLVVAHNADFDRRFCERLCEDFVGKPWGCSYREVGWLDEGFDSARLGHLAIGHGLFFDAHRALDDCRAGLEILARPLPRSGKTAFSVLLESARRARWRIWALGAPYSSRKTLKNRGYRWSDGSDGRSRAWFVDVAEDDLASETEFVRRDVYRRADAVIDVQRVTAFDRYSNRC